jgi:hypothetical protein
LIVPPFAGRVAALEDDHDVLADRLHPVLQLDQLDLKRALEVLVLGPRHLLGVRVILTPGVDDAAVRPAQHRVVMLIVVFDGQAGDQDGIGRPVLRQRVELGSGFTAHVTSTAHPRLTVTSGWSRRRVDDEPGGQVGGCVQGCVRDRRRGEAAGPGGLPAQLVTSAVVNLAQATEQKMIV